ncbi:hypothetical protein Fcan01_23272 [Folsomia candida]|uniref:Uncharacterized protein n=1 Tax=Folsomia candida TaxID=158441 RepID=A0A226DAI1_FOLCA|nr:hypothetical protein Fcan01_23272 [Folsomia candida]
MFHDTEALAVANSAILAPFGRKDFFNGTRVELNLRRITQDCIDHKNGKLLTLSVCTSALCMTTCTDYVDAPDDPKMGGREAYAKAVVDSIKIGGSKFAPFMDELVTTSAMIAHKTEILDQCLAGKMETAPPLGRSITPFEYFESRWWEAAMTVFFKMPLLLDGGADGVPCDENWIPLGTRVCPCIRKAVDVIIRYDELVDIFHDLHSDEPMNEIHVAARYGGIEAVRDYAWASAGSVDEVATCNCIAGETSHEWGADIAIGSSAWYAVVPHYRAFTQLAETRHLTSEKYAALAAKANHAGFITSYIADTGNSGMFHTNEWVSLTKLISLDPHVSGECQHCQVIGDWIVHRCLYRDDKKGKVEALRRFIAKTVHLKSDTNMDGFFGNILKIVAADGFPRSVVDHCVTAVDEVWKTLCGAAANMETKVVSTQVVVNHVRVDKALVETYEHDRGYILRRGICGTLSVMMDRMSVSPYPRLMDAAIIYSSREE